MHWGLYIYGEKFYIKKFKPLHIGCTRQIVLGAQLAAIYVDVCAQYGIKSEKMCNLGEPHCSPQMLKSMFFVIFSLRERPQMGLRSKEKISKNMLKKC